MASVGACRPATTYVHSRGIGESADTIVDSLSDNASVAWLIWLLTRNRRLDRFVRVASTRIALFSYDGSCRHSAIALQQYRDHPSWANACDIAMAARAWAPDCDGERAAQIRGLKRITKNFFHGFPAEV